MARKPKDTYSTCNGCTHTQNIHDTNSSACGAYGCDCQEYS